MIDLNRISDSFQSRHHVWRYLDPDSCPGKLLDVLERNLPQIDQNSWSRRFLFGGLYVNGTPCSGDVSLTAPCQIEYYEPRFDFEKANEFFPPFEPEKQIIFQDADLMAVYKPAQLPAMPAREQIHFNLKSYVERYLGRSVHLPSRLDMSTQGLVILSTTARMHDRLQRLFEHRQIEKYYLLASAEPVSWERLVIDGNIGRHPEHPVLRKVCIGSGKPATTIFTNLGSVGTGPLSLIQAQPLTGRTHQIRVHASQHGFPVVGDNFYGGLKAAELSLLSYRIKFVHPMTGERLDLNVPRELLPGWLESAAMTVNCPC